MVELTVFLTDIPPDFGDLNAVYHRFIGPPFIQAAREFPARTFVKVSGLSPDSRPLVENKAVAVATTSP